MPSRPPPNGPYREADRPEPLPPSPDIDPSILASSPATPILVVAGLWIPPWLLITWLTDMEVRGCGPTHTETVPEKVAVTIVLTLVFALLFVVRARHSRRQSAALRVLQGGGESADDQQVRAERASPRVRLDVSTDTSASDAASDPPSERGVESEPASRRRTR